MSRSTNRIPFHITVPPDWADAIRQAAKEVDMSMTSFIVCLTAEAMMRGAAADLAAAGAERHPTWVKSSVKPPSVWKRVEKHAYTYRNHTLRLKTAGDAAGPLGWYLTVPGEPPVFVARSRDAAEEIALGRIHGIGQK